MVKVKAHASTANLGVLFDCGALAIEELYAEVTIEEIRNYNVISINDEYKKQIPIDNSNLCFKAVNEYLRATSNKLSGIKIKINNNIPLNGGLGSSAASIIASLIAINGYMNNILSNKQLLDIALNLEPHGDNLLSSLYGGFTLYSKDLKTLNKVPRDLSAVITIPDYKVSTSEARSILPNKYSSDDTILALQYSALLTNAILTSDYEAFKIILEKDKIVEPFRISQNPLFESIKIAANNFDALGTTLSGSGSTIISFVESYNQQLLYENMCNQFEKIKFMKISFTNQGARII